METFRILLADDHAAVRRGIRSLLESQPQWEVCYEAQTGQEAVDQAQRLNPDLVLLDVAMPELNGLEAARQILEQRPLTRVLLLSLHQSDELTDEARRAGADGVVLKSDADMLNAAIYSLIRRAMGIHLAGHVIDRSRHIAAFFSSDAERYSVLGPFIAEGLVQGEKAFHIIDRAGEDAHIHQLVNAGVDVDRAIAQGQMEIVPWEEMYLHGGHFDQHAMLTRLPEVLRNMAAKGFPLTRLIANMEWAIVPPPSVEDLVEYESRLNDVLPAFVDVVICAYDLAMFNAGVIIDVMRTHPAVVIGGSLQQNPFYLPPGAMLEELRLRKAEGRGLQKAEGRRQKAEVDMRDAEGFGHKPPT